MGRSSPSRSNGSRRPRSPRAAALPALGALLFVGLLASGLAAGMAVAPAAPTAEVTLRLWPAGQGRIEATQGGTNLTPTPCNFAAIVDTTNPCLVTVTTGTPVTLKAVAEPGSQVTLPDNKKANVPDFPVAQPSFVRWSRFDCGTAESCTFTPESDSDQDWITALFTPLQLQVGVFGAVTGTVTLRRSDGSVIVRNIAQEQDCPLLDDAIGDARWCHAAFPAETDVVVEVSQTPSAWGAGCEPEGDNPESRRCTVKMTNLRTFALVRYGNQEDFQPPFQLTPKVKVKRGGSGQGRVTGSGIDCPSTCEVQADYQARVRLKAEESTGSRFTRWVGVCATDPTCVFAAGSATEVQARFDTAPAPPTTTTTTTSASTTTTSSTTTTTSTTTATTTTTTTTERQAVAKPRLGSVLAKGRGVGRVVAFTIVVDRRARATARLLKQGKTVVSRSYQLAKGRNARRLPLPRTARPGLYRLSVRVAVGGQIRTLVASVRVRG